jgi:hypothetical protein
VVLSTLLGFVLRDNREHKRYEKHAKVSILLTVKER